MKRLDLSTVPDKVLAKAIRSANWQAIKTPTMEYSVTWREGKIIVTEWKVNSGDYVTGDCYLWTTSYPEGCGTPSHEQHALIEQIPDIIKTIRANFYII